MASWTAAHAPGVHSGDVEEVKARVKPTLYITAAGMCVCVGACVCVCMLRVVSFDGPARPC